MINLLKPVPSMCGERDRLLRPCIHFTFVKHVRYCMQSLLYTSTEHQFSLGALSAAGKLGMEWDVHRANLGNSQVPPLVDEVLRGF